MKSKILVVDNHKMMQKFMATLLEKEGFEVKTAKDGISALDVYGLDAKRHLLEIKKI